VAVPDGGASGWPTWLRSVPTLRCWSLGAVAARTAVSGQLDGDSAVSAQRQLACHRTPRRGGAERAVDENISPNHAPPPPVSSGTLCREGKRRAYGVGRAGMRKPSWPAESPSIYLVRFVSSRRGVAAPFTLR
jgi:hypothetical protein